MCSCSSLLQTSKEHLCGEACSIQVLTMSNAQAYLGIQGGWSHESHILAGLHTDLHGRQQPQGLLKVVAEPS